MSYRDELIQVAAVAVAAIQDLDQGTTALHDDVGSFLTSDVFDDVLKERRRQEHKWGPQHHSKEHWFVILGEEVGEVANAIFEEPYETSSTS